MNFIINFIVACFATIAFAKLFHAPNREIFNCGITGAVGWLVYDLITAGQYSPVFATLIATMILTILSRVMAVMRRMPVTVYLIAGIFPLVPGTGIYNTIYYLITQDYAQFSAYGLLTIELAVAITFGILFGSALPQGWFNRLRR